jgi:NADH dehydrogenase [ubiquinone] 1 alpha subcomplex assembly factor 6
MVEADTLSYSAQQLRDGDNDRFLTALFAPADRRESLFALYAFNLELARVAESVTEPMMGHIRLQWWRDRVAEIYGGEPPKGGDAAQALCRAVRAHNLPRDSFDAMLDAREQDMSPEPPPTLDDFEVYVESTSGELVSLSLHTLGVAEEAAHEAGQHIGIAWAIVGHLRAAAFHARRGKVFLPADLLEGGAADDLRSGRASPALVAVTQRLTELAEEHMTAARDVAPQVPAKALPALLLAPLMRAYLRRIHNQNDNLFSTKLEISKPERQCLLAWSAFRKKF